MKRNTLNDFYIQPIEKLADGVNREKRIRREEWWMKELKTLYPYGLNDKCNNTYYSNYTVNRIVYSIFNKQTVTRHSRGTKTQRKIRGKTVQNVDKLKIFTDKLVKLLESGKNWRRYCYCFIIQCDLKLLREVKSGGLLPSTLTKDKNVMDFMSDLINYRFKHKTQKPRDVFMKVFFANKGVEKINIGKLLHKVKDAIPTNFKCQSSPTVLYTRSPTIGSKIFNYKKTVQDLKTHKWLPDDHHCECSKSIHCDPNHKHIVTGNLNFVSNVKLRSLLKKGPSYREAKPIDWKRAFNCIKKGINDCQQTWCTKEEVDLRVLSEWKQRLLQEVKTQMEHLQKRPSHSHHSDTVLKDIEVKKDLKDLHNNFVITPTDKAGNNFSIVCKKFYVQCLLKELNIIEPSISSKSTYKHLKSKPERIVKAHSKYMEHHNIPLTDSQQCLPFLYWIPKMHKEPSKQRYIAASHSCSTKPLSKMITFCLKLIQQTCTNYCTAITKTRGFNRMWIVNNSVEVLDKISQCNKRSKVKNIRTYDFSTLYTSIPHQSLKDQMAWVINQCFNESARKYIQIGNHCAHWKKTRGKTKTTWTKDELINHVKWLIDNIYVVCGDSLFRQKIGIPMGTDCSFLSQPVSLLL
jgi:hypothetical protein